MLGRSAKLHSGLGHKSIKTIYKGSPIPPLTNVAPVWDEAAGRQRNLRMLQREHRLIITKSARRTELFLLKLMAAVPPTGIVIEEEAKLYKIKLSAERSEYECDIPLPIKEWPHAALRLNIMEICHSTPNSTEIYRMKQKWRQSWSRSGHICRPSA